MGAMSKVAGKYRRALRNETGAHFSLEELRAWAEQGALEIATKGENEELTQCPGSRKKNTSSVNTGLASGETESRTTGKSAPIPPQIDRPFIEALGLGTC